MLRSSYLLVQHHPIGLAAHWDVLSPGVIFDVNHRQRTIAPIHDICGWVIDVEGVIAGTVMSTVVLAGIEDAE